MSSEPDRIFSVRGSDTLVLMVDGVLYVAAPDGVARPCDGDIDIHPADIQCYVYLQRVGEKLEPLWDLGELSAAGFEISRRQDSWPGLIVNRRVPSSV